MPRQSDTTGFRCAGDGCRGMTYVIRVVHLRSNKTVRHRICRVCQLRQQSVEMPSVLKEVKPR